MCKKYGIHKTLSFGCQAKLICYIASGDLRVRRVYSDAHLKKPKRLFFNNCKICSQILKNLDALNILKSASYVALNVMGPSLMVFFSYPMLNLSDQGCGNLENLHNLDNWGKFLYYIQKLKWKL